MKKISRLFPLILCTVSVHAAPQWSCPKCTVDQIKPIFEKYATGDALIKMLDTFDKNLNNGVLNARGFARTCRAAGLKGSVGTEGYKKCEAFVLEMSNLAVPLKSKAGASSAKMSECEAEVRAELINKGEMSAGSIVDALKKNPPQGCGFDDTDSYLFKGVTVSGSQAMALAGLLGRKQCRVDQPNGILICENKYAYIFDGLDNNNNLTTERVNNIAKGVCAVATKTSKKNSDMMSFDDNIKGCPMPQVVANCTEYQKQLQKVAPSLVAKEQKEYSQTYCVVSANKSKPQSEATYTAHLDDFASQEGDIAVAIQLIENTWPQLNCSYYDWYNPESGIYSVKCDETKTEKKGPSAHGFRFKKLWCFGDEGEYEYDPKIGGCRIASAKPAAGCTPQSIDTNIFGDATVMPMQAIAMSTRYINRQCRTNEYDCRGKMPNGNNVNCGGIDLHFGNISNSNQGNKANSSIAKGICKMYGGSPRYTNNEEFVVCEGVSRSVCDSSMRGDRDILNESIAVEYNASTSQCVFFWGAGKYQQKEKVKAVYNEFSSARVTPMQAITLVQRYNAKNKKGLSACESKEWEDKVECSDGIFPFADISTSNGSKSHPYVAKVLCEMWGGTYKDFSQNNTDYGWCEGISRSVCEGNYKMDVQLASSSGVRFGEGGACVVNWGPRDGLIH